MSPSRRRRPRAGRSAPARPAPGRRGAGGATLAGLLLAVLCAQGCSRGSGDSAPDPRAAAPPRPALDTSAGARSPGSGWCGTRAPRYPNPLEVTGELLGRHIAKAGASQGHPWNVAFGPDYLGLIDVTWASDGAIYGCSGVYELVLADAAPDGTLRPAGLILTSDADAAEGEADAGGLTATYAAPASGKHSFGRCERVLRAGSTLYVTGLRDVYRATSRVVAYDVGASPPTMAAAYVADDRDFGGMAATQGFVLVAQLSDGLALLRHEGGSLELITELREPGALHRAWDVAALDGYAYVADGAHGIVVVRVGGPEAPELRYEGRLESSGHVRSVEIDPARRRLYAATGRSGVLIADLTAPRVPRLLARIDTPGSAVRVASSGDLLAVADWNEARVYDVADPSRPRLVGAHRIRREGRPDSRVISVAWREGRLLLGGWFGFRVLEVSPEVAVPDLEIRSGVVDFGYVAPAQTALRSIRIANPGAAPLVISSVAASSPEFTVANAPARIPPGGHADVELTFLSTSTGATYGYLVVCSDDPDEGTTLVKLLANSLTRGLGLAAPEVELTLTDGRRWTLGEQRGDPVLLAWFVDY